MQGEDREQIREGVVVAVYPERHAARVQFEDKGGLISAELPVVSPWAFKNKCYALPDVGETVVCLHAGNSEQVGDGWIIGSRYHDKSKPAANSQDIARIDFADGTFLQYDRKKHELRIKCEGKIFIDGAEIRLNEGG